MELVIKHTMKYTATVTSGDKKMAVLSQEFDEDGHLKGSMGIYIPDKELYYDNLKECRAKEDEFRSKMREIEDREIQAIAGNKE